MTATAQMNETQWQKWVLEYAALRGWSRQHSRKTAIYRKDGTVRHATAISGDAGYPDLTLARNGRIVFFELKSETGQLSIEQQDWLSSLSGEPVGHVCDWRGRDGIPDGRAFHARGGWSHTVDAGDWQILVAGPVRPRHRDWIVEVLK